MADPVAGAMEKVCDQILGNFVPPATTILAIRRFNGCMAILCQRHGLVITDEGLVVSVGRGHQGPSVMEDPEPA